MNFFFYQINKNLVEDSNLHAANWQFGFNEPATATMLGIIDLHHTIMFYLIIVFILVTTLLIAILFQYEQRPSLDFVSNDKVANFEHDTFLEIVWTIFPSIIILLILIPSLSLLYSTDELRDPTVTLKIIGHQWYWSYEYSDYADPELNNSLLIDSNLKDPKISLLEVDNKIVLPVNTIIRLLITSEDVLHSWAIPSFGIKMDAIPGRLNQVIFSVHKLGHFYGQCSELCGVGHGFMPIHIEVVQIYDYLAWIITSYLNDKSLKIPYSHTGFLEIVYIFGYVTNSDFEDIRDFSKNFLMTLNNSTFLEMNTYLSNLFMTLNKQNKFINNENIKDIIFKLGKN